jgi:peptidoglycan glycosyltransferase
MEPHLAAAFVAPDGAERRVAPRPWRTVLAPSAVEAIRAGMERAVEGALGRQYTAGARVPGIRVAGKSGTAELGGRGEPHSWFIGFAPADDPEVVIAVLVERGGSGASRASPLAGDMLQAYFEGNR